MAPHYFSTMTISQDIVIPNKKSLKRKRESSDIGNGVCSKRSALKDITNVSIFYLGFCFLNQARELCDTQGFPDYHTYKFSFSLCRKLMTSNANSIK